MSDCEQFTEFCKTFGDDVATEALERIADVQWSPNRAAEYRVSGFSAHRHNACNHTLSGQIDINGKAWAFVVDSGDWAGTVVHEWCDPDVAHGYEPEPPTRYELVPTNANLRLGARGLYCVYLRWREQDWFKDLVRGYAYDKHFAPGVKTESHYKDEASKRGLQFVPVDLDWKPEPEATDAEVAEYAAMRGAA